MIKSRENLRYVNIIEKQREIINSNYKISKELGVFHVEINWSVNSLHDVTASEKNLRLLKKSAEVFGRKACLATLKHHLMS